MADLFQYGLALCAILLFASLSGLVSERSGVVNIGIEGMMTIGALVTAIIGSQINTDSNNVHNLTQIPIVLIGALIAGLFALLHAFPAITLKSNQVISGTALNILALGIAMFLATSGFFGTNPSSIMSFYHSIQFGYVPMWLIVAVVVAVVVWLFFKFTKFGMRYTMVGENPNAVDAAGISVNKYRYIAVFFSGVLAGMAGGTLITTVVGSGNFDGSVYGYGFLAMAIMIFGQWRIMYLMIGVVLFSILFALGSRLGLVVDSLSSNALIFKIIPFALTLLTMILFSKHSKAPAANGIPFDKAQR